MLQENFLQFTCIHVYAAGEFHVIICLQCHVAGKFSIIYLLTCSRRIFHNLHTYS